MIKIIICNATFCCRVAIAGTISNLHPKNLNITSNKLELGTTQPQLVSPIIINKSYKDTVKGEN